MTTIYTHTYHVPSIRRPILTVTDTADCIHPDVRQIETMEVSCLPVSIARAISIQRPGVVVELNTRDEYALYVAGELVPNDYAETD